MTMTRTAIPAFVVVLFLSLQFYLILRLEHDVSHKHGSHWLMTGNNNGSSSSPAPFLFDIVTLVHHDDMDVFVQHGLESWERYFVPSSTHSRIFAICTREAYQKLQEQFQNHKNLILVEESVFEFSLDDVGKHAWKDKHTWIYQQLLKLYSYEVLSRYNPPVQQMFVVLDSDVVALGSLDFFVSGDDNTPIYNIASASSGAYDNDCTIAQALVEEVFSGSIQQAFPNVGEQKFSAIAHYMVFDGTILGEMLSSIQAIHNTKPWKVLSKLSRSFLSEWELYMAFVMSHEKHRRGIAMRQIPYINWGLLNNETLSFLKKKDLVYVAKHDDYQIDNMCCVNSRWTIAEGERHTLKWRDDNFTCQKCTDPGGDGFIITCESLGIDGCHQDKDGLMRFT